MAAFSKKQPDIPRRRQMDSSAAPVRPSESDLAQRYAFKRNRTLTGSASSQVASTNESNAQLKSARVQAHELANHRRRIGVVLMAVILCASVLYMLIAQFTARVVVRTSSDASVRLDATYASAIESYYAQHPIERLRFLLNEAALKNALQTATPEVEMITDMTSTGLGETLFVVEMRRPIASWTIRQEQQYVDASGVSFARNYFGAPTVRIVDNSGIQVEAGQAVASNHFLGFVGRIIGLSNAQRHIVTRVVIPQGTTRQVEVFTKSVSYPVKFSIDRPAGEQVEDMTRAMRWLAGQGQSPQYLDVRVSGRAFYKP